MKMYKQITEVMKEKLINEAKMAAENGEMYTRFQMLDVLDELGITLNADSIAVIEKLYEEGLVKE